jgi:hypothetical protein
MDGNKPIRVMAASAFEELEAKRNNFEQVIPTSHCPKS